VILLDNFQQWSREIKFPDSFATVNQGITEVCLL